MGFEAVNREFVTTESPDTVRAGLLREVVPWINGFGNYKLHQEAESALTLTRRYLPGWGIFFGILLLPGLVGLLILFFYRKEASITFTMIRQDQSGTRVLINGEIGGEFAANLSSKLAKVGLTEASSAPQA